MGERRNLLESQRTHSKLWGTGVLGDILGVHTISVASGYYL